MKTTFIFFIFVLSVLAVSGQNADDYNKIEASGNYLFQRVDSSGGFNDNSGFNGFNGSVTANFSRYFGVKFDISAAFKKQSFAQNAIIPPNPRNFTVKSSVYNYLGGIQVKDNSKEKKVKPFAHFLIGAGRIKQTLSGNCPNDVQSICNSYNFSETGFAAAIGGGIDVKASERISIRAIQADYNPIQFNGQTSNNFRLMIGIVIH